VKKNIAALGVAALFGGVLSVPALAGVIAGSGGVLPAGSNPVWNPDRIQSPTADARFELNPDTRAGHMLIVPYYTVQDLQSTAFHITNTDTVNGKAVKVRFRGAVNSDDVLDFQVFLSPGDVWAAEIKQDTATGAMMVRTSDNSCTLPQFTTTPGGTTVKTAPGDGFYLSKTDRLGGVGVEGTREGYIEIFNMADIRPPRSITNAATGVIESQPSPVFTAIKHNKATGVPPCLADISQLTDFPAALGFIDNEDHMSDERIVARAGFDTPTTGLTGDWFILNLIRNTSYSWAALPIQAVTDVTPAGGLPTTVPARGNFVYFPQTTFPVALSGGGGIDNLTSDPLLRVNNIGRTKDNFGTVGGAVAGPVVFGGPLQMDLPDMSTPYLAGTTPRAQAAQLSWALEAGSVSNQYAIENSPAFDTDWVFTMPTRRYSVAIDYAATPASNGLLFTEGVLNNRQAFLTNRNLDGSVSVTHAGAPFFRSSNVRLTPSYLPAGSSPRMCVETNQVRFMDREERDSERIITGSPATANMMVFCGETSIIRVGTQAVLGADIATQMVTVPTGFGGEGWVWIGLTTSPSLALSAATDPSVDAITAAADVNVGIPMIGYAAIKASNISTRQHFGYTWPHRFNLPK